MLSRSRLALSLCGLALAVPALPAWAAPDDGQAPNVVPYQPPAGYTPPAGYAPSMGTQAPAGYPNSPGYPPPSAYQPMAPAYSGEPQPAPGKHHHRGLFGWKHCVECQRAHVKARDGIDIPAPPSQPGMVYQGQAFQSGPMMMNGQPVVMMNGSQEPGYAVVGPGGLPDGAGYAAVGGPSADPTPIGLARGATNPWADPRMAAMSPRPGGGPYDPSVVPSGIPRAPTPMGSAGHDRPHVISHMFHIPRFGQHRQEREDRMRENHAAIAYGDPNQKVTELPASVVYGKGSGR
jgi:hypothetical protein